MQDIQERALRFFLSIIIFLEIKCYFAAERKQSIGAAAERNYIWN